MRRSLVAFATLALTSGCVIVDPSCSSGGATIVVSPSVVVVSVGQSSTPRASWCRGGRYDDFSPNWSLATPADGNIISVDAATGRITGKRAGEATVVATSAGVEGASVRVTVR